MAGHLGVETPGDPATPPSPRRRRVLRRRGLKKSTSGDRAQLKVLQNKGFGEIMSRFPRKIVARSKNCAHFSILREGDRPDTARGAFSPAKPVKNRPLPGSTTSAATSSWQRTQARGRAGRELTSGAECTHSRRNPEILPKVSQAVAEYVSTVEQSTADQKHRRCMITGTFTTDEELLELVAAVHPELPNTAQFAL